MDHGRAGERGAGGDVERGGGRGKRARVENVAKDALDRAAASGEIGNDDADAGGGVAFDRPACPLSGRFGLGGGIGKREALDRGFKALCHGELGFQRFVEQNLLEPSEFVEAGVKDRRGNFDFAGGDLFTHEPG